MSTEKMRRLAAGYKEGTKSFMESLRLRGTVAPLCGEIAFCPYCGARSIDAGPTRTYCTTCGEDVVTPGQVENLKAECDRLSKDLEDAERCLRSAEEDLVEEEKKVLGLYTEIDDLKNDLSNTRAELEAAQEVQPL